MCMCVSVCVWHACAGAHTEEGIRFSETCIGSCELPDEDVGT